MPPATLINSFRRSTTAVPGDFYYISQADWDSLVTTARSRDAKLAKRAKDKLQKLDVAARMMETNEGRPAPRTCDCCAQRNVPCRIWADETAGQACALCKRRNKRGCNANVVTEQGAEADEDNGEDMLDGGDSDCMAVDEEHDAESAGAVMDYTSTSGTRGEPAPESEEYVDTEKRRKNADFNREFGAILAASIQSIDDLQKETVTRVLELEDEVEGLKDEVSRLNDENMHILNDNQNMKEDLNKLWERVFGSGA